MESQPFDLADERILALEELPLEERASVLSQVCDELKDYLDSSDSA
jgi:hypothetical protein